METTQQQPRPLIGLGACLAGEPVRYDGQSNAASIHIKRLCEHVDIHSFCPEMAAGLGAPRAPIHLVGEAPAVHVVDAASHSQDHTAAIAAQAAAVLSQAPEICAYILVADSPSCGYERVKRFDSRGELVARDQRGIFAAALAAADPLLPLEDDARLDDPGLRESFVTRLFTYHEWKQLQRKGPDAAALIAFYSRYKYLVMAHHLPSYKSLGRLLGGAGKREPQALGRELIAGLMHALRQRATRRSHSNVLFHLAGYLKRSLNGRERRQLAALIEDYRLGQAPLAAPLALLQQHFATSPNAYIEQQKFIQPFPAALGLRDEF